MEELVLNVLDVGDDMAHVDAAIVFLEEIEDSGVIALGVHTNTIDTFLLFHFTDKAYF
jgi:hypothetical protein